MTNLGDTSRMKLAIACLLALSTVAAADPKPPINVTAKVVEIPKPIYFCGVIAFRTVVRFEIVSVDSGAFAGKELYGIVLCPETLQVGATKKLALVPPTKSDQGYVDKFPKSAPRYVVRYR